MSTRVLVVEDNPANRDLISYLLRTFGYEVDCEDDGALGLESALSREYDLILADILMPNMDGYEFARQFRAKASNGKTPLIAVTALAMTGDREKILAAGFDGYISKPIDPQKFVGQIAGFLARTDE